MMPDPISHAEMIAAVKRWTDRLEQWANLTDKSEETRAGHLAELERMRAVLAHLERTQPTDTQADLTERARAAAERYGVSTLKDRLIAEIISIAQSEREAAAAETAETIAMLRQLVVDSQRIISDGQEVAAAEARGAAIEECKAIAAQRSEFAKGSQELDWITIAHAADDIVAGIEGLASPPAPQEETR